MIANGFPGILNGLANDFKTFIRAAIFEEPHYGSRDIRVRHHDATRMTDAMH